MLSDSDDSDVDLGPTALNRSSGRIHMNSLRSKSDAEAAERTSRLSELDKMFDEVDNEVEKRLERKRVFEEKVDVGSNSQGGKEAEINWNLIESIDHSTKKRGNSDVLDKNASGSKKSFKKQMQAEENEMEIDLERSYTLGSREILSVTDCDYDSLMDICIGMVIIGDEEVAAGSRISGRGDACDDAPSFLLKNLPSKPTTPLQKILHLAVQKNELHFVLLSGLVERTLHKNPFIEAGVFCWLFCFACEGGGGKRTQAAADVVLRDACGQVLLNVVSRGGFQCKIDFLRLGLENMFGYGRVKEGKGRRNFKNRDTVTPIDGADDAKDDNDETSDDKCKGSLISSTALFTFLNFWIHIYSSDSVMYTNGGELANALAMVVRVGLDTIFYEGKRVGAVHSRLLGVMVRHYSKNIGETQSLTSTITMKLLSLGPGTTYNCHDYDDVNGILPPVLALRSIPIINIQTGEKCRENAKTRVNVGKVLLGRMLRFNFLDFASEESNGGLQTLMVCNKAANIALSDKKICEEVKKDGCLFYAVVSGIMSVAFAGMVLFGEDEANNIIYRPYGSKPVASSARRELDNLRETFSKLKTKVVDAWTNPHMRRTKELCDVLSINFRNNVDEVDKVLSGGVGEQKTLEGFMVKE